MKTIVLTGGGTAGHVTPNLALIPHLEAAGFEPVYIGSYKGIERELLKTVPIPYKPIASGKLRRYFSFKNFIDPFKVAFGTLQSLWLLGRIKPALVFSKGGFVAVPVVLAAKVRKIPVIAHESDMTPGLANRISMRFAKKICTSFEATLDYLPAGKGVYTGAPIRADLLTGNPETGFQLTGFSPSQPVLLIMGGSLGAKRINDSVRAGLEALLADFQIIHLCGKGHLDPALDNRTGYVQYAYVTEALPHFMAMASVCISRSGSNALSELLALRIPSLLIPLSAAASRGDQILNAKAFEANGYSLVLDEGLLTPETLLENVLKLYQDKEMYQTAMAQAKVMDGVSEIMACITGTVFTFDGGA